MGNPKVVVRSIGDYIQKGSKGAGAAELRDELATFFDGDLDWSDPSWGHLDGQHFSYKFNFTEFGVVGGFMLRVRGDGDAVSPIVAMCKHFGWQAVDTSQGDFINLDDSSTDGWDGFQAFRDRVIDRSGDSRGG